MAVTNHGSGNCQCLLSTHSGHCRANDFPVLQGAAREIMAALFLIVERETA
jgi:hypothetical protein